MPKPIQFSSPKAKPTFNPSDLVKTSTSRSTLSKNQNARLSKSHSQNLSSPLQSTSGPPLHLVARSSSNKYEASIQRIVEEWQHEPDASIVKQLMAASPHWPEGRAVDQLRVVYHLAAHSQPIVFQAKFYPNPALGEGHSSIQQDTPVALLTLTPNFWAEMVDYLPNLNLEPEVHEKFRASLQVCRDDLTADQLQFLRAETIKILPPAKDDLMDIINAERAQSEGPKDLKYLDMSVNQDHLVLYCSPVHSPEKFTKPYSPDLAQQWLAKIQEKNATARAGSYDDSAEKILKVLLDKLPKDAPCWAKPGPLKSCNPVVQDSKNPGQSMPIDSQDQKEAVPKDKPFKLKLSNLFDFRKKKDNAKAQESNEPASGSIFYLGKDGAPTDDGLTQASS